METVSIDTGIRRQTLQTWLRPSSQALTASILGTSPPFKQRRANAPPPSILLSKANPLPCTQRNTVPHFTKGLCLYLLLNSPQIINQRGHGGLVPTAQLQTDALVGVLGGKQPLTRNNLRCLRAQTEAQRATDGRPMGSASSQDKARDGQAVGRIEMARFPGAAPPARPLRVSIYWTKSPRIHVSQGRWVNTCFSREAESA